MFYSLISVFGDIEAASSRLASCLADMGHLHVSQLAKATDHGDKSEKAEHTGPAVLETAVSFLEIFVLNGGFFTFHGHKLGNISVDDDMDLEGVSNSAVVDITKKVITVYKELNGTMNAHLQRVTEALRAMIGQALFHVLITTDLSLQTLHTLSTEVRFNLSNEVLTVCVARGDDKPGVP